MSIVVGHLQDLDVETELIRPVDFNIPFGVESDLGDGDEWPQILEKICAAGKAIARPPRLLVVSLRPSTALAA